ncbi:hypothetical protein K7I13_03075 [Brucepastera parasyntrophica]|uniref:hypothetical protein n=1 Tax=Brucepastera parasyntrophica TaxID=2880008 RepID=UPI00210D02FC|nr:hypothetical protein [Brucepastera parasyntrophica]ULQ60306.1 hypothetical protein K7I13_03075 [Brucepastera parasyntrophica]
MKRSNKTGKTAGILLLAVLLAVLASCSSSPHVQKEADVLKLIRLINEGKVTEVEGLSPAPFVLDSETLYLESDIETLWKNLKAASFTMSNAVFVQTEHITPDSYKIFADTFDMKNFFEKYTDKDTSVVTIDTADGRYYLILERKVKGYPKIRGFKGPVK